MTTPSLMRLPCVMDRLGLGRASIYKRIATGHLTPPVKLGRSSAWPSHEIDQIVSACIKGHSPDDMKSLVNTLLEARKNI